MDSQLFFFINIALGVFFLLWFWSGRKNRGTTPTRLRLRNSTSPSALTGDTSKATERNLRAAQSGNIEDPLKHAKKLNVLFLYNGHDWDAYQVLGVPAGANLSLVTERYQNLVKEADPGQLEFYQAAYQAILKKI